MLSDALVSQHDFFASIGALVGGSVPEGLDSQNHLDAFLGRTQQGRVDLIHEAEGRLSYRKGKYSLLPPYTGLVRNKTLNELGNLGEWGLFDLEADFGEKHNIAADNPELLEEMKSNFSYICGLNF